MRLLFIFIASLCLAIDRPNTAVVSFGIIIHVVINRAQTGVVTSQVVIMVIFIFRSVVRLPLSMK